MKKTFTALAGILLLFSYAGADDIVLSVDTNSTYTPTTIVNGDFDECPWQGFVYGGTTYTTAYLRQNAGNILSGSSGDVTSKLWNGVGEGWNTTEVTLFSYGKLYDWTKRVNGNFVAYAVHATYSSAFNSVQNFSFIEMNGYHPSVFYQDLKTQGGDVIRWTLNHANRQNVVERINVQIGAPYINDDGSLVPATTTLDPKIKDDGKAVFQYNGVTNTTGTYGFAKTEELQNLTLSSSALGWQDARGVYIIPSGQNITRFAFVSELPANSADGNLLDSITFSTLIGNLNAYADWDASVVVSGYWGETDTSKKLCIEIVDKSGSTSTKNLDMTSVAGKNFKIVIPKDDTAEKVKIYHQDYESAAKEVTIERHYHGDVLYGVWNYPTSLPTSGRYALGTDVVLSSEVTLSGNSEMAEVGGAKICLNGHTISGAKITVDSGENKFAIESVLSAEEDQYGRIACQLEVKGGDFTLNGGNADNLKISGETCTVTGLVNISALSLASGKVIKLGSGLDTGSLIYVSESAGGVITSGFNGKLGQIINLPAGGSDYVLLKTKNGELKVSKHKTSW